MNSRKHVRHNRLTVNLGLAEVHDPLRIVREALGVVVAGERLNHLV